MFPRSVCDSGRRLDAGAAGLRDEGSRAGLF